ncbi:MAG: division/cell wall cluster transcriptional repressor MraZ [Clostridium sp.]|jgi:MraZ protein|nr:division/cell wall cluster transcriptional repressor MraZ [Clostridium sp.]MBQ4148646.1 division/cell wall cluster transcriptional repressor MraZ [Clostridium sp.]
MLGQYDHTIDAKGRIIIPAKFREQMGDDFVITKGLDHQLFVYAPDEWNLFEAKLRALPISNPQARKLSRFFLVGASDVTVDKQGRITLPMQLREFAGITKDVLLAGVGNHLEIWNPDRYNELNTYEDMDEVAMSLEGFNI